MAAIDDARTAYQAIMSKIATAAAYPPETTQGDRLAYDAYMSRLLAAKDSLLKDFPELKDEGRDATVQNFEIQSGVD